MLNASSRPKSSYRHGFNQSSGFYSPIMGYQREVMQANPITTKATTESPLVSQLEAPREIELNNALADLKLIDNLSKPAIQKKDSIYKIERVADLEKLWLSNGGSTPGAERNMIQQSRQETDDKTRMLKEKLVMDTVITDQLNKFSMGDASNEGARQMRTIYTSRGNKFTLPSRPASSFGGLSENNLMSRKCKFNCRVKTNDGRIALRELFGILFLHDNSLTVYEFRLLCGAYFTGVGSGNVSKKANALPFIARKVYKHAHGRRKGQDIQVWDIFKGSTLYLPCSLDAHTTLPDAVRNKDFIEIEITDVNELEKENMLTSFELNNNTKSSAEMNRNILEIKSKLKNPLLDVELNDQRILSSVRLFLRKQIEQRSVEVYMGLSASLKSRGDDGMISSQDLYEALCEFNIQMHTEDLNIVWQVLDLESLGRLHYYTVMRAYFGEMNILRHSYFRSLVHKLDPQKTGYIQVGDVYKYYKANRHPRVKSGEMTEKEMYEKFLSSFKLLNPMSTPDYYVLSTSTDTKSPLIIYEQLEEYYNGLSISIDTDADFVEILRNSWNIV